MSEYYCVNDQCRWQQYTFDQSRCPSCGESGARLSKGSLKWAVEGAKVGRRIRRCDDCDELLLAGVPHGCAEGPP
ncbi:hypothetical protein [Halopelagius longus]|uniref:Uncharacterized protein n=1 Tax=Halopelagius longus TaxID=1236180 RepID=A0A1H1EBJ8_9EURY|nr:hypothetical protein [Halopelagius longus]RDI71690.1 hypothetical protein DWB78_08095 [Halopelagius longus]SDQ86191.1 hypothetical protein SAMN05216278_2830 [Halopelagius longus]